MNKETPAGNPQKYSVTLFEEKQSVKEKLSLLARGEKRFSSWYISEKDFAPEMEALRKAPLSPEEGLINKSSGKYVWKRNMESSEGKKSYAYKTNPGKTPYRYIFASSLPVREFRNYLYFEELGIPVVKVIAAGDMRKNFILKEAFIVTEFLENSKDGCAFMPGGAFRNDREKCLEFCRKNMELLARLHRGNFFHKAFHARNILWRENQGDMEIFWIDVARCRKVSKSRMPWSMTKDLHTFFRDMFLTEKEVLSLLAHYLEFAPGGFLPETAGELLQKLLHFRRHLFVKKSYRLLEES